MLKHTYVEITHKGKQSIQDYQNGLYDKADISELEYALLGYTKDVGTLRVNNSLEQFGTEGTAALERLLEEGKLQKHPTITN